MPDVDLRLSLAEIAGVFVGFGALIAVRSAGPREAYEIASLRAVLLTGMADGRGHRSHVIGTRGSGVYEQ